MVSKHLKLVSGKLSHKKNKSDNFSDKAINQNESLDFKNILKKLAEIEDREILINLCKEVILDNSLLEEYAENISILVSLGFKIVVVHEIISLDDLSKNINFSSLISTDLIKQSKHDNKLLEIFQVGLVARRIISALGDKGVISASVSASDGGMIKGATQSFPFEVNDQQVIDVNVQNYPETLDVDYLDSILESSVVPVITPIALLKNSSSLILLNADFTSSIIAAGLESGFAIFTMAEEAILINGKTVGDISSKDTLKNLKNLNNEQVRLKLYAGAIAVEEGVNTACFVNYKASEAIFAALFGKENITRIKNIKKEIIDFDFDLNI